MIQDAFLRMQVYCNEGGEVRNPEAFLVRTALNLSINSRTRSRDHLFVDDAIEQLQVVVAKELAPDEMLAIDQQLQELSAIIDTMTPRTREIFTLHCIDEHSYTQIAKLLGISVSAVEKHMARAMLIISQGAKRP